MLRSAVLKQLEHVASALDVTVRRRRAPGAQAEQRLEGRHGLPPPIVPKDELVQVRLKLRAADAVIGADQPMLKVPDGAVRQRHDGAGALAQRASQRLLGA